MQPWQEEYIANSRELLGLRDWAGSACTADPARSAARADQLVQRNSALLSDLFFPALDALPTADQESINDLNAFADALLDWKTNLDPGVYVALHEALLRLYRLRRDRNSIIRELYKLGMGLYYQRRMLLCAEDKLGSSFAFENELVFSEAASYFRYFSDIEDEETRGYILRSLANIALCVRNHRRKINISARMLQILRDPEIRSLAPNLPWERFLRSTHQQMSANRVSLSRGDLTKEELSAVLDSCYEVFKPEQASSNPSVRWLWPYYEMEYTCGYVSLDVTLSRLSRLVLQTPWNQYDMSGLYANVQLVFHYARLIQDQPSLQEDPKRIAFLDQAYRRMEKHLMTFPPEAYDDHFHYTLMLPLCNYVEVSGVSPYRDLVAHLMMRFFGAEYLQGRLCGDLMEMICETLLDRDPAFFDDLPLAQPPGASRRDSVLSLARDAGLLHDLGLVAMNTLRRPRSLLESEYKITLLHPSLGRDLLRKRASTRMIADVAWGHHTWYNGMSPGYPSDYERTASPVRQITDTAALASFLMEEYRGDLSSLLRQVFDEEGRRFSPLITAALSDPTLTDKLERLLSGERRHIYEQEIRDELERWKTSPVSTP